MKKEEFYGAKKPMNNNDIDVNNMIVTELIEVNKGYKCLIGHLDKNGRPLCCLK